MESASNRSIDETVEMTSSTGDFAHTIRTLRLRAGLSQEELAELAGISARAISDMERGLRKNPRPETLRMLADGLQLDETERLRFFAVVHPEIESDPRPHAPPPVAATPAPGIPPLPIPPDELIGRAADILALDALLAVRGRVRLVTLTGPGGVGKTRLGLAIAHQLADQFSSGVAFIDLAPLTDGDQIVAELSAMLGPAIDASLPPRQAVIAALRPRSMLLLFDNFEHLLPAAPLLAELLAACPDVTILATSRVALNLRGEHRIPVEPLSLPDASASTAADLVTSPAVTLFLTRGAQVDPRFTLDDRNAVDIAEICRSLDGLPLALELAAARVDILSPDALRQRLTNRLPLLTSGARDLPARQQTLRAAIDWSYELLSENERTVFRRLAVFAGGANLEAIEALFGESLDTPLPETLTALVTHNLLRVDLAAPDGPRFSMLETIREFALEELERVHEAEPMRNAHATYFLDLSTRAYPHLVGGPQQQEWMSRIDREYPNLRAAALWWLSHREVQNVLQLCNNIWNYWSVRGGAREGIDLIRQALAEPADIPTLIRAEALRKFGNLSIAVGDTRMAKSLYEESLEIERAENNVLGVAKALSDLGMVAMMQGREDEYPSLLFASRNLFREMGDTRSEAVTLYCEATGARNSGDTDKAEELLQRVLLLQESLDDSVGIAWSWYSLSVIARDRGDLDLALALATRAVEVFHAVPDDQAAIIVSEVIASIELSRGNIDRSKQLWQAALATHRQLHDMQKMAECHEGLALVAFQTDDLAEASASLQAAIHFRDQSGCPVPAIDAIALEKLRQALSIS
jgi:predicted ATPase/transcriptional regulator with XRE-family HTH domain